MKLWEAKEIAGRFGCTIAPVRNGEGEYRVNFKNGGCDDIAYYTTNLMDAVGTAQDMGIRRAQQQVAS